MRRSLITSLFLCLAASGRCAADPISLEAIPERVRAANPSLAAARWAVAEAEARALGAGRRSNPELELEALPALRGGEFSLGIGISQAFPVTDRLRLEKEVSQSEVAEARAEVADAERRLIADACEAAVKWLAADQLAGLRRQQAENAEALAEFAQKRADRGEGSALDAAQFRLEAAQFAYEIQRTEAEKAPLAGALRTLLGIAPGEPVAISGSLAAPDSAKALADPQARPDYQAAAQRIESADRAAALERARRYDDITVGAGIEIERAEDAPEGFETEGFLGLRVSIPLPLWNKNEGGIKEAEARAARARAEASALAAEIRGESAAARDEMAAQAKLAGNASAELLGLARAQVEKSEAAYRSGLADLTDTLRARDQLLAIETGRLEALREYHLARVRYEAATAQHTPNSSK
ncbi:MAG: TolC family protein [Verrucomicrobiales bacterium]